MTECDLVQVSRLWKHGPDLILQLFTTDESPKERLMLGGRKSGDAVDDEAEGGGARTVRNAGCHRKMVAEREGARDGERG